MQWTNENDASGSDSSLVDRPDSAFGQHHYTVDQVAEMWNISRDTIRRMFLREEGVLKIVRPGNRYKRTYVTLRIPESVVNRVYRRIAGSCRTASG
jgi:excisionase family DNA binding protein